MVLQVAELEQTVLGGYIKPDALFEVSRFLWAEILCNCLEIVVVQGFIALQIYYVKSRWLPASLTMLFLILAEFALMFYIVAKAALAKELDDLVENNAVVLTIGVLNAIACLVDVIATFSLFRILTVSRTGFASSNRLIATILGSFVSRGVLLVIWQLLFVIFWFLATKLGKLGFLWSPFYFSGGKLYVTTLLVILNSPIPKEKPNHTSTNNRVNLMRRRLARERPTSPIDPNCALNGINGKALAALTGGIHVQVERTMEDYAFEGDHDRDSIGMHSFPSRSKPDRLGNDNIEV